jgi:hypothetical protein
LKTRVALLGAIATLATILTVATVGSGAPGDTFRASVSSAAVQANNDSGDSSLSANGRYVAFASIASNLAPGDTNGASDVFVRDLVAGTTVRASVATSGAQGNAESFEPQISGDGKFVVFTSRATNLVSGDTNGVTDIFVRDLVAGTTTRVDKPMTTDPETNFGSFAPAINADGRYIAYASSANNIYPSDTNAGSDIFVYDRTTATTQLVSVSTSGAPSLVAEESNIPAISGDGRYVTFQTDATNFDAGDTNANMDIYVRDRVENTTTRISQPTGGGAADENSTDAVISSDGQVVAYQSRSSNLVAGDTNGDLDVFVTNRVTGATERANVTSAGAQTTGSASNAAINSDGSYIAFESSASDLVNGDTNGVRDVFVRNRLTSKTTRESISWQGYQVLVASADPSLDGDGQLVGFHSYAPDLVSGDTNTRADVFVHELGVADRTAPVVTGAATTPPNANGWYNAPVTIDWTAVDPEPSAGPATQPPDTIANTEGANVTYTSAPACDPNLNCATGTLALSIDKTKPAISASWRSPNANGWYNEPVVVGFTCRDTLSGLVSCADAITVSTDGAAQSVTGGAADRAGNTNTATAAGLNIDRTAPTILFAGNAGVYSASQTISISCTANDALSGIDPVATNCPSINAPASMFLPGPHTIEARATDKAGNVFTASTTFTTTIDAAAVAELACAYEATKRQDRVCKKLREIAARSMASAAAGDTKQANDRMKEFIKAIQDERGKAYTQEQASLLTALAALVYY